MKVRALLSVALLTAAALPSALTAQSVFVTEGLGYQLDPMDGRSRGLGGVALGLPEPEISWANPASAIGFSVPGLTLSYQYDNFSAENGTNTFDGQTARFPLLLTIFPAGDFVLVGGFGSYLDQTWRLQRPDTLVFGTDSVRIVDLITSDGGVTRLRFGGAYHVGGGFGVGLVADFLRGRVSREEGRTFQIDSGMNNTFVRGAWRYRGVGYTVGAHWSPGPAGGIGASLSFGGELDAELQTGEGESRSYDLPVTAQVGGSGRILPTLLVALGGSWSGWSSASESTPGGVAARDAWSAQGGIEWDGITIRDRGVPLRLGGRTGVLPFGGDPDGDGIEERAATFGIGALVAGGALRPDLAVEFGTRSDGSGLDESFWRVGISMRVLGR